MAYKYSYDDERRDVAPAKLDTNRDFWKYLVLSIVTLGLYNIFFFMPLSFDLDKIAPKSDRSKTMDFLTAYILSYFTLSIVMMIWHFQICERVEEALERRKIDFEFSTGDFWLWYVAGSFVFIGPFVYIYKLCKAMNLLCKDYNERPVI